MESERSNDSSKIERSKGEALIRSFEELHSHSTRRELATAFGAAMERIPEDRIRQAHRRKLQQGEYEVLEVVQVGNNAKGIPHDLYEDRPIVVRTHIFSKEGRLTKIEPADLPGYERDVHYAEWLWSRIWNRRP